MTTEEAVSSLMNNKTVGFLVGQVMKKMPQANPQVARRLIVEHFLFEEWKRQNGL